MGDCWGQTVYSWTVALKARDNGVEPVPFFSCNFVIMTVSIFSRISKDLPSMAGRIISQPKMPTSQSLEPVYIGGPTKVLLKEKGGGRASFGEMSCGKDSTGHSWL